MNFHDLRYLVALAEHRHFGRAAEACFVTQPTLSTQIKKLEKELGVELIERSPRNVALTDAGERIVARARLILSEETDIRTIARQAQDPESGSLRLGLFPTLAPYLLPHVVPPMHQRFPHLELLLVEEKTEVVLGRLRDSQLDVAILALPIDDAGLQSEALFSEDFVLAVPADHPLAATEGPVDIGVLVTENVQDFAHTTDIAVACVLKSRLRPRAMAADLAMLLHRWASTIDDPLPGLYWPA